MPQRLEIPILFDKGLQESEEESILPAGFSPEMENYIPRPSGGFRARRGWQAVTTNGSSFPSTRSARGIGLFPLLGTVKTPVMGQTGSGSGTGTSVSATWSGSTTQGSLLVATVHLDSGSTPGITATGWTLAVRSNNGTDEAVAIYYKENASSESGAVTFTLDTSVGWSMQLREWRNMAPSSSLDKTASGTGTSTSPDSGTTAATTQAKEVWVAAFARTPPAATTISLDQEGPESTSTTDATSYATASWTPTAGKLILGFVYTARSSGTPTAPTLSGNSLTWTQITTVALGSARLTVFRAMAGSTTAGATTITCSETQTEAAWAFYGYGGTAGTSGNNGSEAIIDSVISTATTTSGLTINYDQAFADSGNRGVAAFGITADKTMAPRASWTELYESGGTNELQTQWRSDAVDTAASATLGESQTSDWVGAALELGVGTTGTNNLSAPTNGFVLGNMLTRGADAYKVAEATGAANAGATLASSVAWAGAVATFKALSISSTSGFYAVAHNDGTNFDIWTIDRDALDAGTWTATDPNLSATDRSYPVAFASGLARLLYTHKDFSKTRSWSGAAVANVTNAPIGRTIAFYRNMFFIGGTADGAYGANGSASIPSRLWYSAIGDHTTWDNNDYIDINKDDGEFIEDLLAFDDGMLIAKGSSLWFLSGASEAAFRVDRIGGPNGGFVGRCMVQTPGGALIAGRNQVWLWTGGEPRRLSEPIEGSYEITGDFVTTACVGEVAYICDEGTGAVWVYDFAREVWWRETVQTAVERPACILGDVPKLLYGPQAATTSSLLSYRNLTTGDRERDAGLPETFKAHTPEIWVGEAQRPFTPVSLYLQIRQRGGDAADAGLVVTPIYDGVTQTAKTITPKSTGSGMFQYRLDCGDAQGLFRVQWRFEQTLTTSDDAILEVERATLVGQLGEPW